MFTVNFLKEDGTSYTRSFDKLAYAVEDATNYVIFLNGGAIKANIWKGTSSNPLGPIEYEFVAHITSVPPEENE